MLRQYWSTKEKSDSCTNYLTRATAFAKNTCSMMFSGIDLSSVFSDCLPSFKWILSANLKRRSSPHLSNILIVLISNSQVGLTSWARCSNSALFFVKGFR